jgi:uncharacterized sulfatase
MDRRRFLKSAGMGCAGVSALGVLARGASPQRQPNILLVIGDDMTFSDCEPYGSKVVRTPNMARLAREGVCFDSMFTATAMCAPTRQQLYTGLYPVRNGAYPNHSWVYDGTRSVVHHLKALGYRVGLIGKTHFGPPESFPFETVGKGGGDVGEQAAAIREFVNRDRTQPYCLIVCSHQPHGPWNKGDAAAYPSDRIPVPPYLVDCEKTRAALPKYYAEITYLDWQLGQCLDIVDSSRRADDTMVIFTSEQGSSFPFAKWTCYENGLHTAFIVRWPAVVEPGRRNNAMVQYVDVLPTLIEAAGGDPDSIDTGCPDAEGQKGFDGRSFLDVLKGRSDKLREYVFGAQTTRGIINGSDCYPVRSVRDRRYKYIRNLNHEAEFSNVLTRPEDGVLQAWFEKGKTDPVALTRAQMYIRRPAEELYDLETDPYELNNRAGDSTLAEVKNELAREVDQWMKQQGDEGIETELKAQQRKGAFLRRQRENRTK